MRAPGRGCSNRSQRPTSEVQPLPRPADTTAAPALVPAGDLPRLAVWEFAGLMLTYWCNSRCAFCYVHSGPQSGGDMPIETAVRFWRGLHEAARAQGKPMKLHLAGGEPFSDWVRLVAIIRAARDAGLPPLEKVETNAGWAANDGLTRARLELLRALGVERLVVSSDVFHQEYIPFERVERCVHWARQIFGPGRLIVRWWDYFQNPVITRGLSPAEKEAAFRAALLQHPDRFTGRAIELAHLVPRKPAAAFAGQNCTSEILGARHVHIDPDGHVFPGTCGGIILGRIDAAGAVDALWRRLGRSWSDNPVLSAVVAGGSYELLQRVIPLGYQPLPEGYASKCHLCADVRQWLHDRGHWPAAVGPAECYAPAPRRTDGLPLAPQSCS
jgi:hypothetical protein